MTDAPDTECTEPNELDERAWANEVIERWETSDRKTRPLSELAAELDL